MIKVAVFDDYSDANDQDFQAKPPLPFWAMLERKHYNLCKVFPKVEVVNALLDHGCGPDMVSYSYVV